MKKSNYSLIPIGPTLGDFFRFYKFVHSKSTRELADELSISFNTIRALEEGRSTNVNSRTRGIIIRWLFNDVYKETDKCQLKETK